MKINVIIGRVYTNSLGNKSIRVKNKKDSNKPVILDIGQYCCLFMLLKIF